ncbi:MAG TPA: hypothetical protein VGK81_00920, partial [Anaerolineae bacterium]
MSNKPNTYSKETPSFENQRLTAPISRSPLANGVYIIANPAMLPTTHMPYQIIYLNGASSAGKTTLGRALQRALPAPFLLLGMDMLVDAMPPQLNDWTGLKKTDGYSYASVPTASGVPMFELCIGPFAQRLQ